MTLTIEAKYIALSHRVKKVIWIKKFVNKLKLEATKINFYNNNKINIALTKNAKSQYWTKYINI